MEKAPPVEKEEGGMVRVEGAGECLAALKAPKIQWMAKGGAAEVMGLSTLNGIRGFELNVIYLLNPFKIFN